MASRAERDARVARLARPGGAFAMLALDQRESLRTMLKAAGAAATDASLAQFKIDAARALTPYASAVLLDVDFGLAPVRRARAIAPGCALIVAADRLDQRPGEPVEDTAVDEAVLADDRIAAVADAYKLLVIWRPDRGAEARRRTVMQFVEACRRRDRPAIVEGIVRPAAGAAAYSARRHVSAVVAAARELGAMGADVYKAEVPTLGQGEDAVVTHGSKLLTSVLPCPWVVLSNGTSPERYGAAVLAACRGGASGFLAGRAIWAPSLAAPDALDHLRSVAAPRLAELASRTDQVARPWHEATGSGTRATR